ncbi:MAG: hypothetical protein HUU16_08645 [Candidatus Omnitrophica bacterium]|nr:hypothetical protein [Candidatus Omnitrophota bacterium]
MSPRIGRLLILVPVCLVPLRAEGHGAGARMVVEGIELRLEASYNDGSPMANLPFQILDASSALVLSGTTSASGCVHIVPNLEKEERLVVRDSLGHRLVYRITRERILKAIEAGRIEARSSTLSDGVSEVGEGARGAEPLDWGRIGSGLGYLLGLTGLGAYWLNRRERKRSAHGHSS